MLKKLSIAFATVMLAVVVTDGIFNKVFTYTSAPFPNRTGSIGDNGLTCGQAGCHSQTATPVTGWITSDIPAEGYTPGATYSLTATATKAGVVKFGFEVTAENSAGAQAGTFVVTDFTNTKTLDIAKKYIGHNNAKADAVGGMKSWDFKWTAPTTGTGTVTFYGAFNASNNAQGSAGDQIFTSTLEVSEFTVGVKDPEAISSAVSVYPNPSVDHINLAFETANSTQLSGWIYDLSGNRVQEVLNQTVSAGEFVQRFDTESLAPGLYIIQLQADNQREAVRFIKQ